MRKVLFTEAQIKRILKEEGLLPYLDDISSPDIPDNAAGYEVGTNNFDDDAESNVTTGDAILKKRSNIRYGYLAGTRRNFEESIEEEVDYEKVAGFGDKSDNFINNQVQNNGGKMIRNVAKRLNNGDGQILNTSQKELERHEDDKKNNPERYQRNGGDKMRDILKTTINRQRNFGRAKSGTSKEINQNPIPNVNQGTQKGHSHGNLNKPTVYYENY